MNKLARRYLVDAMGGMALGLFSTLIIGLILRQIGNLMPGTVPGRFLQSIGQVITILTGAGIAAGVANGLGVPKLVLYSSLINGLAGAYAVKFADGSIVTQAGILLSGPGDPLAAFAAALAGAEAGRLVSGRTKVDILVTPAVTVIVGCLVAVVAGPHLTRASIALGEVIARATELAPFWMGIVISVIMGLLLTLPVSSAAVAIILGLSGIAAGASTAGCAAQMIGFAVISFRDNGINGLFAQGLGTSMLQIPNIARNPRIWIPPTLASAITGPVATVVLGLKNLPAGAGMGTSGLVGPLLSWQAMTAAGESRTKTVVSIVLICAVLPAIISFAVYVPLRRFGWIHDGDMRLEAR